jgi:hypothetical protein
MNREQIAWQVRKQVYRQVDAPVRQPLGGKN